jgi:hypothetical protein
MELTYDQEETYMMFKIHIFQRRKSCMLLGFNILTERGESVTE